MTEHAIDDDKSLAAVAASAVEMVSLGDGSGSNGSELVLEWKDLAVTTRGTVARRSWQALVEAPLRLVKGNNHNKHDQIDTAEPSLSSSPSSQTPKVGRVQLLNVTSGSISSGTGGLWAVMGPSGSGKTTLLSALAMRLDMFHMEIQGDVSINGKPVTKQLLKSMSGYVEQDDLVHSHLTVYETLNYSAQLRMPRQTTHDQRQARIESVMKLMGISHCRDVLVGDSRVKGISGGERKRLCIAVELLTQPKLLFLDEPTSGLDSSTALSVINTLKDLTVNGHCTVITTIHQPQSKIFAALDNLILVRHGDIVYHGKAAQAIDYFAGLGHPCPLLTNPADHLIDVISPVLVDDNDVLDTSNAAKTTISVSADNVKPFRLSPPLDVDFGATSPVFTMREVPFWYHQFAILLRRNLHHHYRRWDILAMNVFVTMLIATFVSMSVWRNIGTGQASGTKRPAALFFCVIHQGIVASLQGSHSFPLERAIMLRERAAGSYYVSAYFLSKTIADMAVQLVSPVIFTCIVYPIIGFQNTASQFMIFLAFMILDSYAATSLANMISCVFISIEMSTVVLACAYEWVRLYGGWFISPAQIASYPQWHFADALSYIKYAFVAVSLNENANLVLHCANSELKNPKLPESASNCVIPPLGGYYPYDGVAYNRYYGYVRYSISDCAGILVAYIVVCRIIGYLGLRYIKI